ncbi:MAG: hypothetical protein J7502_18820 [Flavisolibacter sp.]|nr:hypothetical protein [Flavisolibacter sp.]
MKNQLPGRQEDDKIKTNYLSPFRLTGYFVYADFLPGVFINLSFLTTAKTAKEILF